MRFEYPWIFLFISLPLAVLVLMRNRLRDGTAIVQAGVVVALLCAIAGPRMVVTRNLPSGVAVLVNTSTGDPQQQRLYAEEIAGRLRTQPGIDWVHVFPTRTLESNFGSLRSALREAAVTVPEGHAPRIVLISDGQNANGDVPRTIAELQQMHVPVDILSAPESSPRLALLSVTLPDLVYAGDHFPVDIAIRSPQPATARVMLQLEGGKRFLQSANLQAGMNVVRVLPSILAAGPVILSGNIWAEGLGEVSFQKAMQLRRARVAYLSHALSQESRILRELRSSGTEVTPIAEVSSRSLLDVQLLILGAGSLSTLTPAQKNQVAQFVGDGGGLLFLGGEAQPFKEHSAMDALDKLLPAEPAPPENKGDKCVVLLIDKSSSMEGTKIAMARQSAGALAEGLNAKDSLGILAFDHGYQWIYPVQHPRDRQIVSRQVAGLSASGGTDIPPALSAAYRAVLLSKAKYRHLVLITDGISEEGESITLAREARRQHIAISTVALGREVNSSFLDAVANESGGRSYASATALDLKRITLRDVRDYTGSRIVDHPSRPVVVAQRDILSGVSVATAPLLPRYSRYVSKPGAEVILSMGGAAPDPLYTRWQYGLGRVGLFTSDDLAQWAGAWTAPAGFDRLWANISRDLYGHLQESEVVATTDPRGQAFQVHYTVGPNADVRPLPPMVAVYGPGGFRKTARLEQLTPFSYGFHVSVGTQSGLFRIMPIVPSSAFPATAVLIQPQATHDLAAGQAALEEIAARTGGHFYAELPAALPRIANTRESEVDLWPWCIVCAILLNLADLGVRRAKELAPPSRSLRETLANRGELNGS